MTLQNQIDQAIAKNDLERADRKRSGKMNPSAFGFCYRKQYWQRLAEPETNSVPPRVKRIGVIGKAIEDAALKLIGAKRTQVLIEDDDVKGFADLAEAGDTVTEFKSVHSAQFHHTQRDSYDFATQKIHNILQVMTYVKYLKKVWGKLVFISRDDLCIDEPVFHIDRWLPEVDKEIATNKAYWEKKELPPAIPRLFISQKTPRKECETYCSFKDKCYKMEGLE